MKYFFFIVSLLVGVSLAAQTEKPAFAPTRQDSAGGKATAGAGEALNFNNQRIK
ncbi:MAG: hypothetical protein ACKVU0_14500 [Saprospiraceae bacterium]